MRLKKILIITLTFPEGRKKKNHSPLKPPLIPREPPKANKQTVTREFSIDGTLASCLNAKTDCHQIKHSELI